MTNDADDKPSHPGARTATRLVSGGRDPFAHHGYVNPPVYHASTLLYRTAEDFLAHRGRYQYGRRGTPTSEALSDALAGLEGADCAGVALLPSGLAAASVALLAVLKAGDHVLVTDSVYFPTRKFCDGVLARYAIATTYYDPLIGGRIADLIRPNTRAIFVESPGSLSFEMQDVPAIAAAAHAKGAVVLMDNTWASPLYFRGLEKGVDLSIQSGTKYIGGHSDVMLGAIITNEESWLPVRSMIADLGHCAGPDDIFFGLRGMRSLSVRLERHQKNATEVARWLQSRPEVSRVLYPALPEDPGHALWKRDFLGASGLFGVVLKAVPKAAVDAFVDSLDLFGIGASWGGYESLIQPSYPERSRTATRWQAEGPLVRIHIGLEDPQDLIADLAQGLDKLRTVAAA